MIVDAQIHIWEAERPDRPWAPGGAALAHRDVPLGADEVVRRMDEAGVDRAYVVSPGFEGVHNDTVLRAAEDHPDRLRAIVRFPIDDESRAAELEALRDDPRVAGARLVFNRDATPWLTDGTAEWYWELAARIGLPTMVFAPNRSADVGEVARRHPALRLVVCHFGVDTKLRDADVVPPLAATIALAELPNVAVKVTCAPSMTTEAYPYPVLAGHIRRTIAAFGPARAFWGSDLSRLRGTYGDARRLFEDELGLDARDRALVLGEAILDWFPWRSR